MMMNTIVVEGAKDPPETETSRRITDLAEGMSQRRRAEDTSTVAGITGHLLHLQLRITSAVERNITNVIEDIHHLLVRKIDAGLGESTDLHLHQSRLLVKISIVFTENADIVLHHLMRDVEEEALKPLRNIIKSVRIVITEMIPHISRLQAVQNLIESKSKNSAVPLDPDQTPRKTVAIIAQLLVVYHQPPIHSRWRQVPPRRNEN
jgi:hypothetical protein